MTPSIAYTLTLLMILQSRIDSLSKIGRPIEKLTLRLDSLNSVKEKKLFAVKQKAESVKHKARRESKDLIYPKK